MSVPTNSEIAALFRETASLLKLQDAESYVWRAYEHAADHVEKLNVDLQFLWERGGRDGLETVPTIGPSLAASIEEILSTGHYRALERLRGHMHPEQLFCKLPGIGETLAARIHDELHVETLEELEVAAHDGRLAGIRGIGEKRAKGIALALADYLGGSKRRSASGRPGHARHDDAEVPSVKLILSVDRGYRERAERGQLHCIAPSRFNPSGKAWLPVWHTHREGWTITALFSNTARAHKLGKTRDWVVIVLEKAGHEEQYTVVTEYQGELHGLRVVRGREDECHDHYAKPLPADVAVVHDMAVRGDAGDSNS